MEICVERALVVLQRGDKKLTTWPVVKGSSVEHLRIPSCSGDVERTLFSKIVNPGDSEVGDSTPALDVMVSDLPNRLPCLEPSKGIVLDLVSSRPFEALDLRSLSTLLFDARLLPVL